MRAFGVAGLAGHSSGPRPARERGRHRLTGGIGALAGIVALAGIAVVPAVANANANAAAPAAPPPPAPSTAPGAVYVSPAENDVVYTAGDHTVWVKNLDGGSLTRAGNGLLIGGPSAIFNGSTVIVFGEGTDHALWWTTRTSSGYANWARLGGALTAKPGAVFTGAAYPADPANYSVFVRGTDGALYELDHSDGGWGPSFTKLGGQLLAGTGPAAVWVTTPASPSSITYVLVAGTNRALYLRALGLYGFTDVGGQTTATPALAGNGLTNGPSPRVVGFARGTDNQGYWNELVLGGPGWASLGGALAAGLAATTSPGGQAFVYGPGTDNQVYQRTADLTASPVSFSPGWTKVTG